MKRPTDAELAALLRQPGPAALQALDLSGRNLDNADLAGASLRGANLSGASLRGANLADAVLTNARLVHAKLDRANLAGANLRYANLEGASLTNASLARATLTDASLQRADLTAADLQQSVCRRAFFDKAKLEQALLSGADVSGTVLDDPLLTAANRRDQRYVNARAAKLAREDAAQRQGFSRRARVALLTAAGAAVALAVGVLAALLLGAFPAPGEGRLLAKLPPDLAAMRPATFAGNLSTDTLSLAVINDDRQTDLLTLVNAGDGAYDLVALNGLDGSPFWRTPLPGSDAPTAIRPSAELIIAGRGASVSAYRKDDGALLWTAALPDRLTSYPAVGLHAVGEVVVAHSLDNALTAFDRKTGVRRWQQILEDDSPGASLGLGDAVCAADYDAQAKRHELRCFAAASGAPARDIDLGAWDSRHAFWAGAGGETLYRFVSGGYQQGGGPALAALRAADGAALWERPLPAAFDEAFFENDVRLVSGGGRLALSIDDRIALLDGAAIVETVLADHLLYPLAFDGDLLYAIAVKQRGSSALSVLGIDAATGAIRWRDDRGDQYQPFVEPGELWAALPGRGVATAWTEFAAPGDAVMRTLLLSPAGQPAWTQTSRPRDGTRLRPFAADDLVFIATGSGLSAFDGATGALLWETGR